MMLIIAMGAILSAVGVLLPPAFTIVVGVTPFVIGQIAMMFLIAGLLWAFTGFAIAEIRTGGYEFEPV